MRAVALACAALAMGCGFDPHQTYSTAQDAGGDRVVTVDAQSSDLQDTAGPPEAADAGRFDAVAPQRLDSSDAVRNDVWTSPPDLASARPEAGPEVQTPDARATDVQPDAFPSQPEAGADSGKDLLASPDVSSLDAIMAPDLVPDLVSNDVGSDLPTPCPDCANPAWFCTSCPIPTQPVAIQCIAGSPYDCNGQRIFVQFGGLCPTSGPNTTAQFCMGCNQTSTLTCDIAFPNCKDQIRCPDSTPYCNATTGECSATPI